MSAPTRFPEGFDLATPEERERAAAAVDKLRSVSPEWLHDRIIDMLPLSESVRIVWRVTAMEPQMACREAMREWSFGEIEQLPPKFLRHDVKEWLADSGQELAKWLMQGAPEADA